jgi:hypothetical protein
MPETAASLSLGCLPSLPLVPNIVSCETVANARLLGPVQASPTEEAALHLTIYTCSADGRALNSLQTSFEKRTTIASDRVSQRQPH